jgi:hypothetical protein
MKIAEVLLKYMDRLHDLFEFLDKYLDIAIEYIHAAKSWMEKILNYLEQAINTLAKATEKKFDENKHSTEDHLFV